MSLNQGLILDIVAIDAERGDGLGQVIIEFLFLLFANFVRHMTGVAPHVESGVAAAFFGNVHALIVAIQTEVLALFSRRRFQQLILVIGSMRIMTFNAVTHCGWMNRSLQRGRVLVGCR